MKLLVGNTSFGVYGEEYESSFKVFIDIKDIPELGGYSVGNNGLTVGATVTIAK